MNTLTDYINALGGAASQVVAAVHGPSSAPAPAPAVASSGMPKWMLYAGIGLVVVVLGVLVLKRK